MMNKILLIKRLDNMKLKTKIWKKRLKNQKLKTRVQKRINKHQKKKRIHQKMTLRILLYLYNKKNNN